MDIDIVSLQQTLLHQRVETHQQYADKNAAVLVPLLKIEKQWQLLFIKRAEIAGDLYSGQVAFPGGRLQPNEDAQSAALRETAEEIGLPAEQVEVLGELGVFQSASTYNVTAVVGLVPWPYPFIMQAREVSHVFTIPLNWLADPTNCRVESLLREKQQLIRYDEYDGEVLWGLSAKICHALLNAINA